MNMQSLTVNHTRELAEAASRLIETIGNRRILTFEGEIGAGKTTFITALCRQLGVKDEVSSPTYALVNEYQLPSGEPLYHADLYRLRDTEEALDIGITSYLDSGAYCLIEWPELIEPLLPGDCVRIKMEIVDDSTRKILFL